jgi:doublecortin-like kinase 3
MIENEVNILRRMQHSNIVSLVEDFETNNELYLVMEFLKVCNHHVLAFVCWG